MPGKPSNARDGGWGITYADVGQAQDEYELHHNCTLEWSVYRYAKFKKAKVKVISVVCHARYRRDTPHEVRGYATCEVGSGSGAATMPGAMLRTLIQACDDLEDKKAKPHKQLELAQLPGFEAR